jgi:sialidase-1
MTRDALRTRRFLVGCCVLLAAGPTGLEARAHAAAGTHAAAHTRTAALRHAAAADPYAAPSPACGGSVPFRSGTDGYHTFRIPAVVRTGEHTVLAFAEGRRNSAADDGDIDVVLRRSSDGGCTWGRLQLVADSGSDTSGNPTPVVDPATGRVVLLICRTTHDGARRVYVLHSDDGGASWSRPRDLTAGLKPPDWRWYATGPGHAVALRRGPYAGRLLVPANHTALVDGELVHGGHSLYSDDGGTTWHIGYIDQIPGDWLNVNESSLAELPDGRVYINARDERGVSPATRADAYSSDGGLSLDGPFRPQDELTGPVVQGSVLQTANDGPLLYAGPSDQRQRARMAVRTSHDGGLTWTTERIVSDRPAAYCDLVEVDEHTVGLLYETGIRSPYETLTWTYVRVM